MKHDFSPSDQRGAESDFKNTQQFTINFLRKKQKSKVTKLETPLV